MSEAKRDYKIG
jgi:hypothetical protein